LGSEVGLGAAWFRFKNNRFFITLLNDLSIWPFLHLEFLGEVLALFLNLHPALPIVLDDWLRRERFVFVVAVATVVGFAGILLWPLFIYVWIDWAVRSGLPLDWIEIFSRLDLPTSYFSFSAGIGLLITTIPALGFSCFPAFWESDHTFTHTVTPIYHFYSSYWAFVDLRLSMDNLSSLVLDAL